MRKVFWAALIAAALLTVHIVPAVFAPFNGPSAAFSSNVTAGDVIRVSVTVAGCNCKPALTDSLGTKYHLMSSSRGTFTFSGIALRSGADNLETVFTGKTPSSGSVKLSETPSSGTTIVQTNSGPLFLFPSTLDGFDHTESNELELLLSVLAFLGGARVTIEVDKPFLRRKLTRLGLSV